MVFSFVLARISLSEIPYSVFSVDSLEVEFMFFGFGARPQNSDRS